MFGFWPEGGTLYLSNWEYNGCRIIKVLKAVIENHGGRVDLKRYNHGFIENRTLNGAIYDLEKRVNDLKTALETGTTKNPDITRAALETAINDLESIKNIDNTPIEIYNGLYIRFILDDRYYSISLNENPFFDFHYIKTPVINGVKYSRDACLMDLNKSDWLYDCFFGYKAAEDDCIEAANLIFNQVVSAKNSIICRDSHRERVPNRFDGKYHFETILAPERFEKIDF